MARHITNDVPRSPEQEQAVGKLIMDNLGADMQTGIEEGGWPVLWIQMSPGERVRKYRIYESGPILQGV